MSALVTAVPELVLGKRVVVTSFDSGAFCPSGRDLANGWSSFGDHAISPPINDVLELSTAEFDEWYVFESVPAVVSIEAFVNLSGFSPAPREPEPSSSEAQTACAPRFWDQYERVAPFAYLADGDSLSVVSAAPALERAVRQALWNAPGRSDGSESRTELERLLRELDLHDDLVRDCVSGELGFRDFLRVYDSFYWRAALHGTEPGVLASEVVSAAARRIELHRRVDDEVLARVMLDEPNPIAPRISAREAVDRLRGIAKQIATATRPPASQQ